MKKESFILLITVMVVASFLAGCGAEYDSPGWNLGGFDCIFYPFDPQCRSHSSSRNLYSSSAGVEEETLQVVALFPDRVELIWDFSVEEGAYDGFTIYRNGGYLDTAYDTYYLDSGLTADRAYCYTLYGFSENMENEILIGDTCLTTPESPAG